MNHFISLFQSSSHLGRLFQRRLLCSTQLWGWFRSIEGILARRNMSLSHDFRELSHAIWTRYSIVEGGRCLGLLLLNLVDSLLSLDSLLATVCVFGCVHGSCHLDSLLELGMLSTPLTFRFLGLDGHTLSSFLLFLLWNLSHGHF